MEDTAEAKLGVLNRLVEGSLNLASEKEYKDLMAFMPGRGEIHRAYADYLLVQDNPDNAYQSYNRAVDMFLNEGQTFQAIVSKILAWRIVRPTPRDVRSFHTLLGASIKEESPLQHIFIDITYQELIALMLKLVRVHFSKGQTVFQAGQVCEELYFVVSGVLEENSTNTKELTPNLSTPPSHRIYDNDIFGDIFPLNEETTALSKVSTVTPVEAVKISKQALIQTCKKYPRLEALLTKLYKGPPSADTGRSWSSVRQNIRHDNPIRTTVMLNVRQGDLNPVAFEGMSRDISLGGACIDLGLKYGSMRTADLTGIQSLIEIKLPTGEGVTIPGWVAWSKKIREPGGNSIVAGIKFEPISDEVRDFLTVYCFRYESEEHLMWKLWEEYLT